MVVLAVVSCHQAKISNNAPEGDTVEMRYAENICIVKYEGYTKVVLANPWKKGAILHTYILTNQPPSDSPSMGRVSSSNSPE